MITVISKRVLFGKLKKNFQGPSEIEEERKYNSKQRQSKYLNLATEHSSCQGQQMRGQQH